MAPNMKPIHAACRLNIYDIQFKPMLNIIFEHCSFYLTWLISNVNSLKSQPTIMKQLLDKNYGKTDYETVIPDSM